MSKLRHIIILAGGEGSRFWPLPHKNIFKFLSKPAIQIQLERLVKYAQKITVVTHRQTKAEIQDICSQFDCVSVIDQIGEGMAAAVLTAQPTVLGPALIVNSIDFFLDTVLMEMVKKSEGGGFDAVTVVKTVNDYFPGGYITFDQGRIRSIVEKPPKDRLPSNYVKLVVDYFADLSDFTASINKVAKEKDDQYEKALSHFISSGKQVGFIKYEGPWVSLKYPWHVLEAMDYFLGSVKSYRGKNIQIADSAVVEGEVYLDDNVKIYEYSKISGPAFIGNGAIIGNYCLIRGSMIGAHCLIGGYTEVTRSWLGEKVFLHRNYVGDSVLSDSVVMGAGAVLANWRFDEEQIKTPVKGKLVATGRNKLGAIVGESARIGVNSSIMPGVKIASGAKILPHQLISRDFDSAK